MFRGEMRGSDEVEDGILQYIHIYMHMTIFH